MVVLVMAVVQREKDLLEDIGRLLFGEVFVFDDAVEKLAAAADLSDEVDVLVVFEIFV